MLVFGSFWIQTFPLVNLEFLPFFPLVNFELVSVFPLVSFVLVSCDGPFNEDSATVETNRGCLLDEGPSAKEVHEDSINFVAL